VAFEESILLHHNFDGKFFVLTLFVGKKVSFFWSFQKRIFEFL